MNIGPQTEFAESLHAEKYRGKGESFREAMNRISAALTDNDQHYDQFRDALLHQRFLPGGRIQTAVGSTKGVTPYNCFVSGTIEDSLVAGEGSILNRLVQAGATMQMGGGIGYDFSTLRPRGAIIKKLASNSTGPISFMGVYDALCRCISSSGHRRGAQMGVLRVDHPDIQEFVNAKQNQSRLTGFNISVAVTDEFMQAVKDNQTFALRFGGEVYSEVEARALWEMIMRSTYDWAEPGILFIDRINEYNNLWYCETIAASNPCGEQPLPPFGACLLGSFNLTKYLYQTYENAPWEFNWPQLKADIPAVVRAMDNVIDHAKYPLYEQEKEATAKRRMGLGVTGVANCIEALFGESGLYGSTGYLIHQDVFLKEITHQAYYASINLAEEKGRFPAYDSAYLDSKFVQEVLTPKHRKLIKKFGIRNSHLTSIAPCGTISVCADNVSSGIEPVYAYSIDRLVLRADNDEPQLYTVQDYGRKFLSAISKTCEHVTVEEHLNVLANAQKWVDSAVSKTCNVPHDIAWEDFKGVYMKAWELGCKGCTTYRVGCKREGILKSSEKTACYIDESGKKECE